MLCVPPDWVTVDVEVAGLFTTREELPPLPRLTATAPAADCDEEFATPVPVPVAVWAAQGAASRHNREVVVKRCFMWEPQNVVKL